MGDKLSPITLAAAKKSSGGGDTKQILEEIEQTPVEAGGETLSTIDDKLNYIIERDEISYLDKLVVYDNGDEKTNVTGGWSVITSTSGNENDRATATKGANALQLLASGGFAYGSAWSQARTINKIDITHYKYLVAKITSAGSVLRNTATDPVSITFANMFGLVEENRLSNQMKYADFTRFMTPARGQIENNGIYTLLDIEDITGELHIVFNIFNYYQWQHPTNKNHIDSKMDISEVYLLR